MTAEALDRKPAVARRPARKVAPEVKPVRRGKSDRVTGLEPRVDLLPGEVHAERRERATVRRAWLVVVLVAVLVVLGSGAAYNVRVQSQDELAAAQASTTSILTQQQAFSEVRRVQAESQVVAAGQRVGGSTQIDWADYLGKVQAQLPEGVAISGLSIDTSTPMSTVTQPTAPLQGQRVATIVVTANSATLPSVPTWISSLSSLPGFVDANADSVAIATQGTGYTTSLTLHVDADAYDRMYTDTKADAR